MCATLVFTTAIAGNLANYIQSRGEDYHWHYDFHKGESVCFCLTTHTTLNCYFAMQSIKFDRTAQILDRLVPADSGGGGGQRGRTLEC